MQKKFEYCDEKFSFTKTISRLFYSISSITVIQLFTRDEKRWQLSSCRVTVINPNLNEGDRARQVECVGFNTNFFFGIKRYTQTYE